MGRVAAGADVWEEAQGAEVLEDIAAHDRRWWYLLLSRLRARAEQVGIQEDLAQALSEESRNHKVAIIEERKHGIEPVLTARIGCAIESSSSKLTDGHPICRLSRSSCR